MVDYCGKNGGVGSEAVFWIGTDGRVEEEMSRESISNVGSKSSNRLGRSKSISGLSRSMSNVEVGL